MTSTSRQPREKIHIPKRDSEHPERLKEKVCKFPDCEQIYFGTGASKFCPEHRKKAYRRTINQMNFSKKDVIEKEVVNQIIPHKCEADKYITMKCQLDGCNESFEIKIIHGITVYPMYCPIHRNEYKRKLHKLKYNNVK